MSIPAHAPQRGRVLAVAALMLASTALGLWAGRAFLSGGPAAIDDPALAATLLPEPRAIAPFELVDHRGAPFTPQRLQGRWSVLFFGYTHCPDVCPMTMQLLNEVAGRLSREELERLQFVLVSVDPERDTVERMAEYVPFFNPAFLGVTGTPEAVAAFTRDLGVLHMRAEADASGHYLVDHTASLLLVDPAGRLAGILSTPHDINQIARTLHALASQHTS